MNVYMEGWDDFSGAYSNVDSSDITYRSVFSPWNPSTVPFFVTGRGGYGKAIRSPLPNTLGPVDSFSIGWAGIGGKSFVGFAWQLADITSSANDVVQLRGGSNVLISLVQLSLTSFQAAWNTTSGPVWTNIGGWRGLSSYCEFGLDPGAGTLTIIVDGVTRYTTPPGMTVLVPTPLDSLVGRSWIQSVGAPGAIVDDLYVNDATGTYNNTFWGDTRIVSIPPNSDGDIQTMIPSRAGAHWNLVNEVPPDEDTTYVSATGVNQEDTYNFPNLGTTNNVGTLHAVQVMAYCKTEFGGLVKIKGVVRKAGVDYLGPENAVPAVWTGLPSLFEINPATGAPWTVADIGVTQFGEKRTV